MKKLVVLLMLLGMVAMLAGCVVNEPDQQAASNQQEQPGQETVETGDIASEPVAMIANPFVAATDEDIIEQLGIPMNTEVFVSLQSEYIIDGRIAQIDLLMSDPEGNKVETCLRATKDADSAENLHGLYYEDMTEPEVIANVADGVNMYFKTCDNGSWTIYEWNNDGIYYTLTYSGSVSQMQVAATLDQVFLAVGLTEK